MNQDFIKIKQLQGELVLSHNKGNLATSITTKEIFFQKPHNTYHILLKNILSIIPIQLKRKQTTISYKDELHVHSSFSHQLYKITVSEMIAINRNGKFIRQNSELILPLTQRFLEKIDLYSDLTLIPTH
jgi:hypothetical protein